jgi:trk system potassium uptake protein TrkA
MRVVVAGDNDQAFYLVGSLLESGNDVTCVCRSKRRARLFAENYDAQVLEGDPTHGYVLDDVDLDEDDLFVALLPTDADGFVSCLLAHETFGVKRTICIVENPRNVPLFESLGIWRALSSAYLLAHAIGQASTPDDMTGILHIDRAE